MGESCRVCGARQLGAFYAVERQPVLCTVLWPTAAAARAAPAERIELVVCAACGFVRNRAFDPAALRYQVGYENSLHHSGVFRGYARALAQRLIDRHGLRGRRVVEIGSGSGAFLALLCELGRNEGVGFDPSFVPPAGGLPAGVTVRREAFAPDAVREADLLTCQHVLEHVPDPRSLLEDIARQAAQRRRPDPLVVYFEVPNGGWIFERPAGAWDVTYEHCSYFTAPSLRRLFTEVGFAVRAVEASFHGQYLGIEAVWPAARADEPERSVPPAPPAPSAATSAAADAASTATFAARVEHSVADWRERLDAAAAQGPVALWGAGAKAVVFLNRLDPDRRRIDRVVDLNPRKQGTFVSGTGHPVVGPRALAERGADSVVVMNGCYADEVAAACAALGLPRPVGAVC